MKNLKLVALCACVAFIFTSCSTPKSGCIGHITEVSKKEISKKQSDVQFQVFYEDAE